MKICLVSSSFYPATFYGGPISATWDLSKKLAKKGIEVYVWTTNANGFEKLNVETNKFIKKEENLFVKYYNEQAINKFSFKFLFGVLFDIRRSDIVYIQYIFHYTSVLALFYSWILGKKRLVKKKIQKYCWGISSNPQKKNYKNNTKPGLSKKIS